MACKCCHGDDMLHYQDANNLACIDSKGEMLVIVNGAKMTFNVERCPRCGHMFTSYLNLRKGDDIWYDPNSTENSELAGLTPVQENHWTSGVVTINGEAIKLGTTTAKTKEDEAKTKAKANKFFFIFPLYINNKKLF